MDKLSKYIQSQTKPQLHIRDSVHQIGDGLQGLIDETKKDANLKKDTKFKELLHELKESEKNLQQYINTKYLWD